MEEEIFQAVPEGLFDASEAPSVENCTRRKPHTDSNGVPSLPKREKAAYP